uniref:Rac GTPase-activating protein 1 (inferred by orthology to a human protein) n=1 Tax=Strongyloides venezuelensis TaxID=75913 RepID=A0A0K0FC39_STRVS
MGDATDGLYMSKKSKRTMNTVDGLILKNLANIFRNMGKEYNDVTRALEVANNNENDTNIEDTINRLIKEEEELKEKLHLSLERAIKINEKALRQGSSPTVIEEHLSTVKKFDSSQKILRNGLICLSKKNSDSKIVGNEKDYRNNYLVPAKENQTTIVASMSSCKNNENDKNFNKTVRRSIDILLRPCPSGGIGKQNDLAVVSKKFYKKEKNKATFKDDQKLEECDIEERKENFKQHVKLRRSISEGKLLEDVPVVENLLLERVKMKENSNHWTPLDLGCQKKENPFTASEIKHVLPINIEHTYSQKKGFNIRCCYCRVRKFSLGGKVVCTSCGIEMHVNCKKPDRNVPCVVMEKRRKMEQVKQPAHLGKICTFGRPMIPAVLIKLVDRIETSFMISTPGLYSHVSVRESDQETLKAVVEEKFYVMFDDKCAFSVPNALKRLLKNLAEAIIPPSSWGDVCLGIKYKNYKKVYSELLNFPVTNKDTLAFLIRHLQVVHRMSDKNNMTLPVIVNQFAPLIVGLPKFKRDKYGTFNDCTLLTKEAFQFLMEVHSEFWDLILRTSKDPPFCIFMEKDNI